MKLVICEDHPSALAAMWADHAALPAEHRDCVTVDTHGATLTRYVKPAKHLPREAYVTRYVRASLHTNALLGHGTIESVELRGVTAQDLGHGLRTLLCVRGLLTG